MAQETLHVFDDQLGDGTSTAFPFDFQLTEAAEVEVTVDGVVQPSGFAVALTGTDPDWTGGTVTFAAAPANGAAIRIRRRTPLTQATKLPTSGNVDLAALERRLDQTIRALQELDEVHERALIFAPGGPARDVGLPAPVGLRYWRFNADGSAVDFVDVIDPATFTNPLTNLGDLIVGAGGGAGARLAIGAAGRLLSSDGTDVVWGQGPLTADEDLLVGQASGTAKRLAKGLDDTVLSVIAGGLGYRLIPTASLADKAVTLPKLATVEASAQNAAAVTVTLAATTIATVDLGTVAVGDRILVTGKARFAKGATAGQVGIRVEKSSGLAAIVFGDDLPELLEIHPNVPLAAIPHYVVSGVARVTTTGTLILRLAGESAGSDSTVDAGQGQLYALVLRA